MKFDFKKVSVIGVGGGLWGGLWVSVALFVVSMSCFAIQSEDLFMYLAIAQEYFKTGAFPVHDPFLFSIPQYAWTIFHQWLGYLAYYALYEGGGYSLIILTKTALITGTLCFPLIRARRSPQATLVWGVSVLLAVFAMSFRMMERTSLFTDFFIVVVLYILLQEQRAPSRWKYLLPVIFGFWVNLHPGFPVGWFLGGLFLLVNIREWRTPLFRVWLLVGVASVGACLLNPLGVRGFLYPFQFMNQEGKVFREFYFEWMPTMHSLFRGHSQTYFILSLILLNLVLIWRTWREKPFFEMGASLFFILYGLYAIRFVPSFCFALVTLNTALGLKGQTSLKVSFRKLNAGLAMVALAFAIKNIFWGYETISGSRRFGLGLDERLVPEKAAALLNSSGLQEHVYNSHLFGSYLAWAWEGKRKILYHGFVTDTDFFLKEYMAFGASRERFDTQVVKFQIGAFFLDRFQGNEALLNILTRHPQWRLVYKDEGSLIFLKNKETVQP